MGLAAATEVARSHLMSPDAEFTVSVQRLRHASTNARSERGWSPCVFEIEGHDDTTSIAAFPSQSAVAG